MAGDTMLGRQVADLLDERPDAQLFGSGVREALGEADLFLLNLECCVSARGERWSQDPRKPFFFRAPPHATRVLEELGTDVVTLGNNHALDFGVQALRDTFTHLDDAGIAWVGAGPDVTRARAPVTVPAGDLTVAVVGATDHPDDFAAGVDRPGVALAALRRGVPGWLAGAISDAAERADVVVVSPHWGPNMVTEPVPHVREVAGALVAAGATVVAGHSAHVFHGVRVEGSVPILYDLGDFVDDYAVDPLLRNDRGVLWFLRFEDALPVGIEALPLELEHRFTRVAEGECRRWIEERFVAACAAFGTEVELRDDRLVVALR